MIAAWMPAGIELLDPWFLLLLPVAAGAWLRRALVPRAALPTASVALFEDLPRTLVQRLAWLPVALLVLAAFALVVALARPVERQLVPVREQGIDIVLVVDISSSMEIEDMAVQGRKRRMDAARARAEEFAAARTRDRVALIAFARYAELRCPPTLDERALSAFLRVLDTVPRGSEFDGTAIGTALAKAVQLLRPSTAKSKVVVLLTDGENTVDDIKPLDAAALAKDAGVRVHTIGLGQGNPTPFGFRPLDFSEMQRIAELTGGHFFQPKTDQDLAEVYSRIDALERIELEDPRYRLVDRFELPLAVGLGLLFGALLLELLLVRRTP